MWLREPMLTKPWVEKGADYGARWDELMRTALGPLADDDEAMAVLRAVIHPEFFDNVRAGKRSMSSAGKEPWGNNRRDEGRRLIGHEVYHGARREQDDRRTERRGPFPRSLSGTLIVSPSGDAKV